MLTCTHVQAAMVSRYVRKTAAPNAELNREAIDEYFRLKAAKAPAPLKNAAFGRVKESTLCQYVKGHATAAAVHAARAAAPKRGGQTLLPAATEKALAAVILKQWQAGLTLTNDQVIGMATVQADELGTPFTVRLRARAVRLGFVLSPGDRMRPGARQTTGTSASARRTGSTATVASAAAQSTARRLRLRPPSRLSSRAQL